MSKKVAEFAIAGSLMIGRYPHIPIRFELQNQLRRALGITIEDEAELVARRQAQDAGEPVEGEFESTMEPDPHALLFVNAAAIGLCWPQNQDALNCPTIRECRHDVVEYGAGVYDELIGRFAALGRVGDARVEVRRVGNKLITDMVGAAVAVMVHEVAAEKVFTKARGATSIAG